ncbi:signal peptidase I [Myxococcota bacterium]|nr:signal peptidase I [Myxococcota bacterium]
MSETRTDDEARAPDKRTIAHAKAYLKDRKKLFERHAAKLAPDDRRKLEAAITAVEGALEEGGGPDKKRLSTALKELDARVDQHLAFAKKSTAREYAESIAIAIFIAVFLRAFVVEAFKIPSGSMIPTLAVGDHIFVNKFIYGLRVPLTNAWFAEWGTPSRGEVIVFRFPDDTSKDYIKRVVGVAGDHIRVEGSDVFVNGKKLERETKGPDRYVDEGEEGGVSMPGFVRHVLAYAERPSGDASKAYTVIYSPGGGGRDPFPKGANLRGLDCPPAVGDAPAECVVQPGHLFVMGDNRDNSSDSRTWGCVPTAYVKGRAMFVWWSRGSHSGVRWERFGQVVE